MIQGVTKTEANYRDIYLDSSSSLKDFSLDRKKYYRKYILGEEVEDKDSQASIMGKIVETLLMEPHRFDEKFYMSACASKPTAKMLEFVENLYTLTKDCTNEDGVVTKEFSELLRLAYEKSGYKISFERVIKDFSGTDNEIYYNEIRVVRSRGLINITAEEVATAERIVEELKNNPVTRDIVNLQDSARWMVRNQLQVEGFEVNKHVMKAMMDKVIIDHKEKTIQVYDLKCVWAVENFYEEYYLYRRAYIQGLIYWLAAHHLVNTFELFKGYTVNHPKFIVCDSTNYYNPLIYAMDEQDMDEAMYGFEYKGRTYPGVSEIIDDLNWALEFNTWNISRKNSINNGVVKLRPDGNK